MIIAAKHRTLLLHTSLLSRDKYLLFSTNKTAPLDIHIHVKSDIKKTLSNLEKDEIEDDKQLRLERGESINESGFDFDSKTSTGNAINMSQAIAKKGKSKPMQMPEIMKSKLVNETAMKAAGGTLKSWMLPKGSTTTVTTTNTNTTNANTKDSGVVSGKKNEHALKPYVIPMGTVRNTMVRLGRPMTQKESRRITLKDALHCLEADPVLKKSDIICQWYSKIK